MKKSVQTIYLVIFAVLLACPVLVYATVGRHLEDRENYENRELAAQPSLELSAEGLQRFAADFERWFTDQLPFRSQLVTASGLIDYRLFHDTDSESVIIGRDGWLFYKGSQVSGEDPVADYAGTNLFSGEELQAIADNVERMQAELEARGVQKFVVMFCPNKERVYADYMPAAYGQLTSYGRLEQLTEYLRANTDVPVVNAYESLQAYRQEHPETQLYFKYDTHWNNKGAFIGGYALNTELGVHDLPPLEALAVDEGQPPVYDLARLLHLGEVLQDDPAETLRGYTFHSIEVESREGGRIFSFNNPAGDGDPRKVLMIGDSFSALLAPYIAANFNHMYDTFYYTYTPEDLEREQPDIVVYEVVERYIANLGSFSLTETWENEQAAP